MKLSAITLFFCITCFQLSAQKDTEFPKEFVLYAKLHNGMVTDFGKAPDLYAGGIQLVPQYTIVANAIRAGINCGVFYTGQRIQGAVGPVFSFKLKTIEASLFGSVANIHINIEHLWGTEKQRLLGGGFNFEIGRRLILALTVHRDYNLNNWWLQNSLGIRLNKISKKPKL